MASIRPLTVLQFGLSYAPKWQRGGPPRIMYDYARHLIAEGFRVMVLTSATNRPKPQDNWTGFPKELEVHYCRKLGGVRSSIYFDYSWRELTAFFDKHWREIDFIHLYQTRSIFNVVALWAANKYGLKIVLSSFGSMPRRRSVGKFLYDQMFVLPMTRRATLMLAQTNNECEVYRSYDGRPDHVHLLPLAVDLQAKPDTAAIDMRRIFREKYGIPGTAWLFVFVGRLHPTKGVDFLVHAFAKVVAQLPQAHLAIVGHDEGSAACVLAAIETHHLDAAVTLCGPLYDNYRWQAYAASDCFVITPEVFEETSLASLEALACGTPVVTNERAEVPWLEEYGAGYLVRAGDQDATAAALLKVCQSAPDVAAKRREAAARLVREKFEIAAVTRQLAALLRTSGPVH